MPGLAVEFYAATTHLRPGDKTIWQDFIAQVRNLEEPDSPYRYTELESMLNPGVGSHAGDS
jgi:hypothetical protein